MRKESIYNEQSVEDNQPNNAPVETADASSHEAAFRYLKSLPLNHNRPVLDSYKKGKESDIIDDEIAQSFTDTFRGVTGPFYIPVSWTLTKSALINLLGITAHTGMEAVNGVRFYAGINCDDQLTLIAVSTTSGTECHDDLTVAESYPYYDYADPCPVNCSNTGNLKALSAASLKVAITE